MGKLRTTILTGFLGAGKTTLLNHLLSHTGIERIAVVVNEYGEVGIDGNLIVETQDLVLELNNGCICCKVRADLIAGLCELLNSGPPIDRIIIETSGLADPAPIIQSFILEEVLAERLVLDAIVTVVDAGYIGRQLSFQEAKEQISYADVILLNKISSETEESLAQTEARLRGLNPLARIIRTASCTPNRAAVLDIGAFDLQNILAIDPDILVEHEHVHEESIGCVAICEPYALDPTALNAWLTKLVQSKGKDLLRMKGILNFRDEHRRYVFHSVHMTVDGRPGKPWRPLERRLNKVVFIGRHLDEELLRKSFASCRAEDRACAS